jgi:hypothetical protein
VRRRSLLAAATAAALAIGLSGCGIPDETAVHDAGAGPEPGNAVRGVVGQGPPTRASATTREAFVANFLSAAAGEINTAGARVREYLGESEGEEFEPEDSAGIKVVRTVGEPAFIDVGNGALQVKLKVEHVGVLNKMGSLDPPSPKSPEYTFEIRGTAGTADWYVSKPPPDLLLSTEALRRYYTQRTIYFWSKDHATLVPDARYMPYDIAEKLHPTEIVEWLLDDPPIWLDEQTVSRINPDSDKQENVPYPSNRLEVGLDSLAVDPQTPGAVERLAWQLMWSLRPYLQDELELRIDGQSVGIFRPDEAFEKANVAHRTLVPPGQEPQRFAVYQGKIHRLKGSRGGGAEPLPQLLLAEGVNQGIVSAALAQESGDDGVQTAAALVTGKDGRFELRVSKAIGAGARPFDVSGPHAELGRPVWLKAPMDTGLIVADGRLYRFTAESADLVPVPVPGVPGKITDVAAAPDGRRIAVVAGSAVYVLGVSREGAPKVETSRRVPTSLSALAAVDWSAETVLAVAGKGPDGKFAVWKVSVDGAIEDGFENDIGDKVGHLVAYPKDPLSSESVNPMYHRDKAAYNYDGDNSLIEAGEVVGASGEVDPQQVTAPFFLLD